jgi:hypothetical protein
VARNAVAGGQCAPAAAEAAIRTVEVDEHPGRLIVQAVAQGFCPNPRYFLSKSA